MRRSALPALVCALACLALTACPDKGKEMMQEAREAHSDAVNDVGGAPKRQIDHTVGRVSGSIQKGMDRLDDMPTE